MITLQKTTSKDIEKIYKMYINFQYELLNMATNKWDIPSLAEYAKNIMEGYLYGKYVYFIKHNKQTVGFVSYQDATYDKVIYLEDFYIIPEFRKQNIGYEAIKVINATIAPKTKIFWYVLRENINGKYFWDKIANKMDWIPIEDESLTVFTINETPSDLLKRSYIKK